MTLLAAKAGHGFDLRALEPEPFLAAMIASFRGDEVALVAQVRGLIGRQIAGAFPEGGDEIKYSVPKFPRRAGVEWVSGAEISTVSPKFAPPNSPSLNWPIRRLARHARGVLLARLPLLHVRA